MRVGMAHRKTRSPTLRWLDEQLKPARRHFMQGIGAGVLQSLLMCLAAWLIAHLLDRAIFGHAGLRQLWPLLGVLPLLALARGGLTLMQRRATFAAGASISHRLRQSLEQRMRDRGPLASQEPSSGDTVTRLVDGVDMLVPYYAGYLPQAVFAVAIPAIVLLAVLSADAWSAIVLVVAAPLLPVFMLLAGKAAEQASQKRWLRLRRMGAQFMDALSGLTTLRLYRAAEREARSLASTGEAYRRETMAVLRIAFLSALVLEFFATISIAVLAVLIGFRLMWGQITFEHGLFVLLLAPEFFQPLRMLGTQRHRRMDAVAAATDLMALLAEAPMASNPSGAGVHKPIKAQRVTVSFEHVGFGYDGQREVLLDVDLAIEAGTRLTLVGATGSGKSTLLTLLMGFAQPRTGRLRINGEDLAALDPDAWRAHIAWVPQRAHIFHGTLRDNLLIAAPNVDRFTLEHALHATGLIDVVARLPRGLDTPLGERGAGLSGGERQRVALARAWLRRAPLWLLDEPWQHLDQASAARLEHALRRRTQSCTVLRIAHRLQTVADDERVAVLADGRIVETGVAGRLRASNSLFAQLAAQDHAA